MTRLEQMAQAIEEYEKMPKWYNNPGGLRDSPFKVGKRNGFAYFNSYQEGWKALLWDIKQKCLGNSVSGLKPDSTILQFFKVYAPSEDKNNPLKYANYVAKKLDLSIYASLSKILEKKMLLQKILCIMLNFSSEREAVVKEGITKVEKFFDSLGVESEIIFHSNKLSKLPEVTIKATAGMNNVLSDVTAVDPVLFREKYQDLVNGHHFVIICYDSKVGNAPIEFNEVVKGAVWGQLPVLKVSNSEWVAMFASHELLHGWYYRTSALGYKLKDEVHTHAWGDPRPEANYMNIVKKFDAYIPAIFQPISDNLYIPTKVVIEQKLSIISKLIERYQRLIDNLFNKGFGSMEKSKYSLTYTGVIVFVIGYIFQLAGVPFVQEQTESTVSFILIFIGVLQTLYGRFRMGDLTPFGFRKN